MRGWRGIQSRALSAGLAVFCTVAQANNNNEDGSWSSCTGRLASVLKTYDGGAGPIVDLKKFQEEAHNILSGFMGQQFKKVQPEVWFQDGVRKTFRVFHDQPNELKHVSDQASLIYTFTLPYEVFDPAAFSQTEMTFGLVMRSDGTLSPHVIELAAEVVEIEEKEVPVMLMSFMRTDILRLHLRSVLSNDAIQKFKQKLEHEYFGAQISIDELKITFQTEDLRQFFAFIRNVENYQSEVDAMDFIEINSMIKVPEGYDVDDRIDYAFDLNVKKDRRFDFSQHRTVSEDDFPKRH